MPVDDMWARLGIEPTNDARAIRVAYARALKAIDVDTDPAAFVALREAFEFANASITAAPQGGSSPTLASARPTQQRAPSSLPQPPQSLPHPATPDPLDEDAIEQAEAMIALEEELNGVQPADPGRLFTAIRILIAAESGSGLGDTVDTQQWLLRLIDATAPRSDPILSLAVQGFGWDTLAQRSPTMEAVVERWRSTHFPVRFPEHADAYRAMLPPFSAPDPETERRLAPAIRALFRLIDEQSPTTWDEFDPDAVVWWRDRYRKHGFRWLQAATSIAVGVVTAIGLHEFHGATDAQAFIIGIAAVAVALLIAWVGLRRAATGPTDPLRFTWLELAASLVSLALPIVVFAVPIDGATFVLLGLGAGIASMLAGRRVVGTLTHEDEIRPVLGPVIATLFWCVNASWISLATACNGLLAICCAAMTSWAVFTRCTPSPSALRRRALLMSVAAMVLILAAFAPVQWGIPNGAVGALPFLFLAQHLLTGHARVELLLRWHFWALLCAAFWIASSTILPGPEMPPATVLPQRLTALIAIMVLYRNIRATLPAERQRF